MIYVLFGPPGVGKTYIGELVSKDLGIRFFDADILFDEELKRLLQNGGFSQAHRDSFFDKLGVVTEHLLSELGDGQDLLIAQAFIKNKNRNDFAKRFDKHVKYILVKATRNLAHDRMNERLGRKVDHVVNDRVFDYSWEQFERPMIKHEEMTNMNQDDDQLVKLFTKLIK